jgi:hypothetical protein
MQIISRFLRQDKITIFNGIAGKTDNNFRWQVTVIEGARVEKGRGMLLRERGIESSDKALLIIDLRDYKATDNREYVNAKKWEQSGQEEKKRAWTMMSSFDFFIATVVEEDDRLKSKEELMNKYEVFSITDVSEEKGSGEDIIILKAVAK